VLRPWTEDGGAFGPAQKQKNYKVTKAQNSNKMLYKQSKEQ